MQTLQIDELKVPERGEGQVLVKIEASVACHTDLHAADGDWLAKPTLPFVSGHEAAGYVAGLGYSDCLCGGRKTKGYDKTAADRIHQ